MMMMMHDAISKQGMVMLLSLPHRCTHSSSVGGYSLPFKCQGGLLMIKAGQSCPLSHDRNYKYNRSHHILIC